MIDWHQQWECFSPHFVDGKARVDLSQYGGPKETILMDPGPGFGDLSHPTTQMTLQLALPLITPTLPVTDIGCGSGILSLAVAKTGAPKVHAYEICPQGLAHAKSNAVLNHLQETITFPSTPISLSPSLILCNMTYYEQIAALKQYAPLFTLPHTLITSGILEDQADAYLSFLQPQHYQLIKQISSNGWCAFHFQK
ncbi:MAG: Ribosomal protein L11 methyltransferase [Chlamydiia bacterium]|nr:Ribosomal protein L11 methyltransferase [Chlamydiia bacterium]